MMARRGAQKLGTDVVTFFGVGVAALLLTFATGFGPCGPTTALGHFLISVGILDALGGAMMMIAAILRAAFGRK